MREANLGVVVHRQHPCLRSLGPPGDGAYWNGCGWGGSILLADSGPGGGSLLRADYQLDRRVSGERGSLFHEDLFCLDMEPR